MIYQAQDLEVTISFPHNNNAKPRA